MKKFITAALAMFFLMTAAISAEAAGSFNNSNKIAVVIVGSADYKTKEFIKSTKNIFKSEDKNIEIVVGKEPQNKYQKYWFNEGLLDEGTPTKEDFVKFVNWSGYKKVVYLVIKDSVLEQHGRKKGKDRSRVSLTINAFIVDKNHIEESTSATNEEDSKTSELRAKLGAFKQCNEEISEIFIPLFK